MIEPPSRPDPDHLLRRVQQGEARARRGKLKIFFGFAPGVGKTYRMLQVARELAFTQQVDLVVGVVETHERQETSALLSGLELLPRKPVEYRGRLLQEFDLDSALLRRPTVILMDELAHTNAPGCRHAKRWQDVDELLDVGIDVLSTMNVQHIESLNDVVALITHVHVRETVPDSVLDRADAVELVDIAPEELLRRLRDGKVYLPDQAQRAAKHFFRPGNLMALRELALRRTAQHVDEDVREYREEHGITQAWPAIERILVCVGPAPSSGRLIRAAARMAAGLRCPWVAAYVEPAIGGHLSEADRERIEVHLRVAETLGAGVTRIAGQRVAEALLAYARKHNVTQVVIGKPTHSRLRDRLRGSLLDEIVRGSGELDIHVISGEDAEERTASISETPRRRSSPGQYFSAALIVGAALLLAALIRGVLDLPDLSMLFLLAVIVSAAWCGRGPAMLAASLAVIGYDFFFVPPFYSFAVGDHRYLLTFAMMFAVGLAMSELAGRLRRQEQEAIAREERTAVLYSLTTELSTLDQPDRIAAIAARHAANVFSAPAVILAPAGNGELRSIGSWGAEEFSRDRFLGVATWAHEHAAMAGVGTETLPGSRALCVPLRVGSSHLGVLALLPGEGFELRLQQRSFLELFSRQVAFSLERARLSEEARSAALRAQSEEMRSSLFSAVSHDLRTPLATITGAATSLRDDHNLDQTTRSQMLTSILDQADRLERLVASLLDMTKLESGALVLKREWVPIDEVIGSALTRLERQLGQRSVLTEVAARLPLLHVDPVLLEQLFVNLLENVLKYTPADSPVHIDAVGTSEGVDVEVRDHGPGIPAGWETKIFDKFVRGPANEGIGAGLGLAICKGIAAAHGGSIVASNNPGGGASFRVRLPTGGTAPPIDPTAIG